MKIYRSIYQQILNMPSTEANNLTEAQLDPLLKEASRLAIQRRANAIRQMEKAGIKASIYSDQPAYTHNEGGNMSYRYVDFEYHPDDTFDQKRAKFMELKRFLSAKTSTFAGIKKSYTLFKETLTASLYGGKIDEGLRNLERQAMSEGWSARKLQKEKEKLIHQMAEEARQKYGDVNARLKAIDDSDMVDKFWETYRRVREEKSALVYGSDSVKDILYQEITDNPEMDSETLAKLVSDRLESEVYLGSNRAGHNSFNSGGGYQNGSHN